MTVALLLIAGFALAASAAAFTARSTAAPVRIRKKRDGASPKF